MDIFRSGMPFRTLLTFITQIFLHASVSTNYSNVQETHAITDLFLKRTYVDLISVPNLAQSSTSLSLNTCVFFPFMYVANSCNASYHAVQHSSSSSALSHHVNTAVLYTTKLQFYLLFYVRKRYEAEHLDLTGPKWRNCTVWSCATPPRQPTDLRKRANQEGWDGRGMQSDWEDDKCIHNFCWKG
jgi:hypothetical protein